MNFEWSIFSLPHEFCLDTWTEASEISDRVQKYGGWIKRLKGRTPFFFHGCFSEAFMHRHLFFYSWKQNDYEHFKEEAKRIIESRLGNAEYVKKHTVICLHSKGLSDFMNFVLTPTVQSILMVPAKVTAYLIPKNLRDEFEALHGELCDNGEIKLTHSNVSGILFSSNGKMHRDGRYSVTHLKGAYK